MKRIFIVAMFAVVLFSCDKQFDDFYYIINSTEETIVLKTTKCAQKTDSLYIIYPNEKKLIFHHSYIWGTKQRRTSVKSLFCEFSVSCDSIVSTYDYFEDDNWIYTKTSTEKTLLTADYIMVVEPSHFEE